MPRRVGYAPSTRVERWGLSDTTHEAGGQGERRGDVDPGSSQPSELSQQHGAPFGEAQLGESRREAKTIQKCEPQSGTSSS